MTGRERGKLDTAPPARSAHCVGVEGKGRNTLIGMACWTGSEARDGVPDGAPGSQRRLRLVLAECAPLRGRSRLDTVNCRVDRSKTTQGA